MRQNVKPATEWYISIDFLIFLIRKSISQICHEDYGYEKCEKIPEQTCEDVPIKKPVTQCQNVPKERCEKDVKSKNDIKIIKLNFMIIQHKVL